MRLRLVVVVTALCMIPVACIPLHQFIGYPFEDVATFPSVDDDFLSVDLTVPFRLGTIEYTRVHINNNGLLSFERPTSAFTPLPFPIQGQAYVSPFWADVDTRMTNDSQCDVIRNAVYLKEYVRGPEENAAILQSISAIVVNSSPYQMNTQQSCPRSTYEPQWAFVVSWIQVGYYNTHCDKHNSFQAILTTNGVQSFAIFNYGEIQWVTGDASGGTGGFGGTAALVGINAADGNYTMHLNSLTDAIAHIDMEPGNVNSVLGQWVYRTDASSSSTNTGIDALPLTLAPLTGHVLGGTPIYSYGRCLEGIESVRCSFGDEEVEVQDLGNGQILCTSPEMATFGRVSVTLQITFGNTGPMQEEVTFYAISPDVAYGVTYVVMDLEQDGHTLRQGDAIDIRWSTDILPHREDASYQVDILLYRRDEDRGSLSLLSTVASDEDNDGSATVTIPSIMNWPEDDVIIPVFLKVAVAASEGVAAARTGKWAPVAFLVPRPEVLDGTECNTWATSDPIEQQHLQDVVCCPLTAQSARWRTSGLTEVTGINRDLHAYYNPMADTCFQQTAPRQGTTAGQHCCYKTDGSLHTGPSGGGTVDSHVPVDMETFWNHQIHDVAPSILCCKENTQCRTYFGRRPSDGGCILRPPACVYGDPHIVTLDGHKYTFNGKGEYTLIATQDNSFTLQGRMADAPSSNGSTTSRGTVFSAIAAKHNNSDTVQFQLTDNLVSLVNGVTYTFEEVEEETFANVIVRKDVNGSFSALFTSGVYLEVRVANNSNSDPYISAVIVSLPESFSGQTLGLMGNYNGDMLDDLVPRLGGDPLPLNSSLETLHWDFGVTWIIDSASDSLFFYDGSSFDDLYDPLFTPVFEVVFSDPGLQGVAEEMCQGDVYCLFDIAATGDTAIGLTTLTGVQDLDEMIEESRPIVCSPPCANGVCVANDTCSCSEGYTGERCTDASTSSCASNVCGIGGSCSVLASTLSCSCRRGYSGQFCETGPSLIGLTPDAETSFDSVNRGSLERLLGVWGVANVALGSFSFQHLSEVEGYSFVVDSGSQLYKLDIRPASTQGTMRLTVAQY